MQNSNSNGSDMKSEMRRSESQYFLSNEAASHSTTSTDDDTIYSSKTTESVLIIGATGRLGAEIACRVGANRNSSAPMIYGMSRDIGLIPAHVMKLHRKHTEMLIEGDATDVADLHRALEISQADTIVVSLGINNNKNENSHVRTDAASSLAQVLQQPHYQHIRVIVVSWAAAQKRRHEGRWAMKHNSPFQDHLGQEEAFSNSNDEAHNNDKRNTIPQRTTIVRPTRDFVLPRVTSVRLALCRGDPEMAAREQLHELARWVSDEIVQGKHQGLTVHVANSSGNGGSSSSDKKTRMRRRSVCF